MTKELVYLVGGVNGVGKSTLIKELSQGYPQFDVFRGSTELMKWLALREGDYETLRALPDDYKNAEAEKMMRKILTDGSSEAKTIIIDAHYLNYKEGEMVDTTGEWMGLLSGLFVIMAPPNVILARIKEDEIVGGKKRNLFPADAAEERKLQMLDNYLVKTLEKAEEVSKKFGIPCYVIDNSSEGVGSAISQFLEYDTLLNSEHIRKEKNE